MPTPIGRLGSARLGHTRLGLPRALVTIDVAPTPTTFTITFPSPRLSLVTAIGPTSSAFTITFPSPRLSIIVPIGPVPTSFPITFPSPGITARISGGIYPTPSVFTFHHPVPAIGGGLQTIQVWLGGTNVTKYLRQGTTRLTSATQGRWTATMDLWDPTGDGIGVSLQDDPTRGTGQAVLITEGGARRFMGCLNQWDAVRVTSQDPTTYTLSALDKSAICDHRIVPTVTYPVGMDVADVVRSIWATSLNGEGIAMTGVAATLGALELSETFDFVTVTQAFDRLATDALATWWIDVYGVLYFVSIGNLPEAPFSITETSKNWVNMKVSASLTNYRNKQYVKSNLSTDPTQVPSVTETYTLPQPKAEAAGYRLGTIVTNFQMAQIVQLKVNGAVQPVQDGNSSIGINLDKSWWAILPTLYLYAPDATLPTPTPPLGWPYEATTSPFPADGDVIEIEYIPVSNNIQVQESDALVPSLPGLAKCGSGIYEFVEQVKNVRSAADMLAIAQAIIARSGQVPLNVSFLTFTPGLQVGMILPASIPKSQIPDGTHFYISNITAEHVGYVVDDQGRVGSLGHGSGFKWSITGTSGADQLNAIAIFEKLVARTENPLPIVQYETETLILAPGTSISAGTVAPNPAIVRQSGKLVEVVVACGIAPTDQTLVIDVINSAYGSILQSPISIPSGDTSIHVVTTFLSDPAPTYVLVNQGLTATAKYVVTGANPVRAGSVTVLIRWQV